MQICWLPVHLQANDVVSSMSPTSDGFSDNNEGLPRFASLLQPMDVEKKLLLPNCTVCRGCNADLEDISAGFVRFQHVQFQHGRGGTNNFNYFARTTGVSERLVLKVRDQGNFVIALKFA